MISLGLANKLGLPVVAHPGTFSTADGTSATFAGKIDNATLALHPEFELKLAYLLVSPSNDYLFLLGNNILRHHPTFSFVGLSVRSPSTPNLTCSTDCVASPSTFPCLRSPVNQPPSPQCVQLQCECMSSVVVRV